MHPYGECSAPKPVTKPHGAGIYSLSRSKARELRDTAAWRKMSIMIRERDGYVCRLCLSKGFLNNKDLSVHHIIPVTENSDLSLDENNLITLCRQCHDLVESDESYREVLASLVSAPISLRQKS